MKKSITLRDIAESLNLSASTVSKALNNSPEISENTKKRVHEAAALKHYIPNVSAQILKGYKTKSIGVVMPTLNSKFYTDALNAIEQQTDERNYRLILCISNESYHKEVSCVNKLVQSQVDGIIISPSVETYQKKKFSHLTSVQDFKKALVLFDRISDNIECDKISINLDLMVEQQILKLHKGGYKKVGFVASCMDEDALNKCKTGYYNAIENIGQPDLFFNAEAGTGSKTYKHFIQKELPDAVIVCDALLALEIEELSSIRSKRNKEVEVVCINQGNTLQMSSSKIRFLSQNGSEQGKISADLMMDRVEGLLFPEPMQFVLESAV
ncbi:LacI family DNA-binding transcriptional regulator [Christiangramia portivictoriae]|uniref:LacI family DNA-binding transcriptional regulator n=1 Tax=Christiangramia portivictoriae TaxID=326069 RepID=UPI0004283D2A|nr:LacI family DNA-binding transcriptional regulator [Christiangramia portivictoriae]